MVSPSLISVFLAAARASQRPFSHYRRTSPAFVSKYRRAIHADVRFQAEVVLVPFLVWWICGSRLSMGAGSARQRAERSVRGGFRYGNRAASDSVMLRPGESFAAISSGQLAKGKTFTARLE